MQVFNSGRSPGRPGQNRKGNLNLSPLKNTQVADLMVAEFTANDFEVVILQLTRHFDGKSKRVVRRGSE